MAFWVQEVAVGRIQVGKLCWDKFLEVIIFAVWDSFIKYVHCENRYVYGM